MQEKWMEGLPEEDKDILGLLQHFMIPDGRMTGWMLDMDSVRQTIIGNIVYPMNWSLNRSATERAVEWRKTLGLIFTFLKNSRFVPLGEKQKISMV